MNESVSNSMSKCNWYYRYVFLQLRVTVDNSKVSVRLLVKTVLHHKNFKLYTSDMAVIKQLILYRPRVMMCC